MIIDRFEGDFAVVEKDGKFYNVPRCILPENAKEGSVLKFEVEKNETEKRTNEIKNKMDRLFRN